MEHDTTGTKGRAHDANADHMARAARGRAFRVIGANHLAAATYHAQ